MFGWANPQYCGITGARTELGFQHVDPGAGNESTTLRIDGLLPDQSVCLPVDAGDDVLLLRLADASSGLPHGDDGGVRIVPEFDR